MSQQDLERQRRRRAISKTNYELNNQYFRRQFKNLQKVISWLKDIYIYTYI